MCPQAHARRSARCSHTRNRTSGRSNTCRASTPATGANVRSPPQPSQVTGRWTTTSSGSATWARYAPGAPGCLPAARPPRRSPGAGGLPSPSDDGGRDELEESPPRRRSSSATRACSAWLTACNSTTWAISVALVARSSAMSAAWTATIAPRSRSCGGSMASAATQREPGPLAMGHVLGELHRCRSHRQAHLADASRTDPAWHDQ
jgi:hypothetical protein